MATHDYDIANQTFPNFRSDLNSALDAIQSTNSGESAPSSAIAGHQWYNTTDSKLQVYTGSAWHDVALDADGDLAVTNNLTAAGTIQSTSDRNLKTGIHNVQDAVDKVYQLNGVQFTWKKNGEKSAGIIAQDVQKVLPEAVVDNAKGADGYLSVNYNALHSLYIEAIKELKDLVDEQAKEIELLKKG